MGKRTITFTTLGLLALLSCGLVLYFSCDKSNCNDCVLSETEKAFIPAPYTQGFVIFFENDVTKTLDTLNISSLAYQPSTCSIDCGVSYESDICTFSFSHLGQFQIDVYHNQSPFIQFYGSSHSDYYMFTLNTVMLTVKVNNTTYNDIYSVQASPDSASIRKNGDQFIVPWKIYYSKSTGFVRFYMINGQTWSKM
jgi:hypothetical protein